MFVVFCAKGTMYTVQYIEQYLSWQSTSNSVVPVAGYMLVQSGTATAWLTDPLSLHLRKLSFEIRYDDTFNQTTYHPG